MLSNRLSEKIAKRLRLPLIAAPMLAVSGPDLVIAACKAGVIGSFPLANARSVEGVNAWLTKIETDLAERQTKPPTGLPHHSAPT
jgi:nitronate monooxygenase